VGKIYISTIDANVAGEPLRLVTGGPKLKGKSIYEKQECLQSKYDYIRTATMLEPRGHADMFGAFLTEPSDDRADMGILFFDGGNYSGMCGHGAIAIGIIAVEMGFVSAKEPATEVVLETLSGLVKVNVAIKKGKIESATLRCVPSFLYQADVKLPVFDEELTVDIAYGGNFFALVDIGQMGFKYSLKYLMEFKKYGIEIRKQLNKMVSVKHPENCYFNTINDILFTSDPEFSGDTYKRLLFFGQAQFDRSPCGTGTCARMWMLFNKGLLKKMISSYMKVLSEPLLRGEFVKRFLSVNTKLLFLMSKAKVI